MVQETATQTEFVGTTASPAEVDAAIVFIPIFQDADDLADLPGLDEATGGEVSRARSSGEFRGKPYESFLTPVVGGGWKAGRIALVGAGRRSEVDVERWRRVAAASSYTARLRSIETVGWVVRAGGDAVSIARAAADGLSAAEFDGGSYKRLEDRPGRAPRRVTVVAPGADRARVETAVRQGRAVGEAVNAARSLANEPGNVLTPREFANRVAALARAANVTVDLLDERKIRDLNMGLLLGVAQGSAEPPRLIVLRYDPPGAPARPVLGFVGKGITFDTGGISIKPAEAMDRMKDDMSGGAAVATAIAAIARLGGRHRILGVIPASENMPGGTAVKPGDVLTGASGKTVEIINTDAEGRLVLGDALWYAQEQGATHLVDVATLTGACTVALGKSVAGLFGSPEIWVDVVRRAGKTSGEPVWPLPIDGDYREMLRSEIADIVNSAGRPAGTITAACFLREFVDDRPWAHLDIAGTAWAEDRKAYQPKGATGAGVRLLIELGLSGALPDPARAD